jgi:lysophospholipase L1-like esterase
VPIVISSDQLAGRWVARSVSKTQGVAIVDLADQPRWTEAMYRDGVHPTKEGNSLLASILE